MSQANQTGRFRWSVMVAIFVPGLLMLPIHGLVANEPQQAKASDGKGAAANALRIPSRVEGVLVDLPTPVRPGDKVEKGQVLARVDDELARNQMLIAEAKLTVAKADLEVAQKVVQECEVRFRSQQMLVTDENKRATSKEDVRAAQLLWETKAAEVIRATGLLKIAELELAQAKLRLDMHQIRSPVRGTIQQIMKRPGEATSALETVLVIAIPEEK